MPLSSNSPSVKVGLAMNQNALSSSENHERSLKPEEDKEEGEEGEEEEDEDFNPFLKDTPSQEASSSLSSEVDGLDGNVVTSGPSVDSDLSKIATKEPICMISQSEINQEKHNDLTRATNGNGSRTGELSNKTKSRSPVIDIDNEDAICMRTRARYSLASFTLDELETFLQETDDDDDLQNADDEEEYKRFLAAVLQSGDGDGLSNQENENLDDDEDNDVDFEIELEELLESDADDNASVRTRKEYDGAGRRPETRQNKRQKVSTLCEKKTIGEVKKPLRPILPNWLNGPLPSGKGLIPEATLSFQSSASGNGLVNGFTAQQIGQLHCLIHEHVQLLIQVFSLSVLEPSQKQVASQVQGLLSEMLHKRDEILSLKRVPYPSVCFSPSFSHSSVLNRQRSCLQATESSFWVPFVRSPVQSILDVSPLNLVRRYVDDVSSAAQEFRKRYIASGCDSPVEKEPLFPFSSSMAEANGESSSGTISRAVNAASTSPGKQKPKKTLAAMLVESTKKQSIALVPKEVAKLAQRFLVLFNPALFPHKPPPAAVVNRILFTDSEDELLALGIMEYNTDWKAIQQRFLPCKSKHQIFVRQKNRCSSKASENPIKAVRRMKTSPLTAEEIACVQEGLKIYKFDWMSVWQYIVPHRDPSLLPRQWRIALGTQKSYKIDASKREKRRLYESKRRKLKAAALESWQAISDKENSQILDLLFCFFGIYCDLRNGMNGAPSGINPKKPVFDVTSGSKYYCRPYRSRKAHNAHLVKLAPDLPPVNLPPSVRVVSQTAFKGFHLFHSSQQQSPIDCANQSIKSKDSTSRSGGIDFHPLLQKSDDMPQSPTNFDAIPPESQVNSGVPAMANTSSGLNDKCNELDLEIHLSSVSGREKCVKTSTCELASSAPLVVPNDNIARYDVDDIGDQSHPGIVMEQEELSDSEEDIEEHVEFECEEMTDSEGEDGSGCEQALEVQNKEVPISSEENVVKCMADMKKPREPRANSDTQVDGGLLTNNTIQNITLTSEGQDDRSCSSWLSLDSCSADNPVLCKATLQRSTIGEASASRNFSVGKAVKDERHTIDMVQLPNIGRHVSTTPRKSRKRSGKVNANLNIGLTVESSSREVNHENG
uniref:Myb-like protein O n=1 Tax=Cajanus cajan TaxID=3821 RepID=A0A151T6V1_CAJCA|nr:Myb-like protein O [Cajanus cajan]